ncbi:MAG: hypothetical protein PHV62_00315 [Sulfuricurvum sp.]|nr:hypothetical protein [Sulfuricurvum sp.]
MTLFSDPKTGQVFTTAGEGRVEMGDFVDAKTVDMANREQSSALSEYQDNMKKYTNVSSHAKKLDFSGTHYFGLTSNNYGAKDAHGNDNSTGFELRRNYVQVKAFFNDKDYFRVTLDATKELETAQQTVSDGPANVIVKYAYLYLDKILPYTGVEIGIAHRPWIDYEEHNSWYYRSINKVVLEDKFGQSKVFDAMNSADLGVNFQTKTPYFSSEIGLFNGEGYHSTTNQGRNDGLSAEWRLTGHVMGNGEHVGKYKVEKDTYANVSFAGLATSNRGMTDTTDINASTRYNRNLYVLHAVYNQPEFLIAAQIDRMSDKTADTSLANSHNYDVTAWSVNAEYRPMEKWTVLGRFDHADITYKNDPTSDAKNVGDADQFIYGVAYDYNKNVKFIASGKTVNSKDTTVVPANSFEGATTAGNQNDKQSWMLTTEVNW